MVDYRVSLCIDSHMKCLVVNVKRVAIARAIVLEPEILVLDEATSALDVSVQDSIADLLARLQKKKNLTYLFIAHDIAFIRTMCHKVVVMYKGAIVEELDAFHLADAKHPYSKGSIEFYL